MYAGSIAVRTAAFHQALGGAGLGHWLVRLFIWHAIFRLFRLVWLVPTAGPFLVILIVAAVIGLIVWRGRGTASRRGRGSTGYGTGTGPRDW
jgi:hypothetical protein